MEDIVTHTISSVCGTPEYTRSPEDRDPSMLKQGGSSLRTRGVECLRELTPLCVSSKRDPVGIMASRSVA